MESTADHDTVPGLGLLPVATRFRREKRVAPVERTLDTGVFGGDGGGGDGGEATGDDGSDAENTAATVTGYEIHAGRTRRLADCPAPVGPESAARGRVLGTYLHELFENEPAREAFLDAVFAAAGTARPAGATERRSPYDAAAALVRDNVDLAALGLPEGE